MADKKRRSHWFIGRDRDYFIQNLSMLISSGLGILESLESLRGEMRSLKMHNLIGVMAQDIDAGTPLWKVLDKAKIFSDATISLVRVGEEAGKLGNNLRLVGEQEEKNRQFLGKIRSAMLYPAFVLGLTAVIGIGIAWFILPKLATVFSQLRLDLPLVTRILIKVGTFLSQFGYIAMPGFILALALLVYFIFYNKGTKIIGQTILFSLPGVKELIQNVELARFSYLLATLMGAGLPVISALRSVEESTVFPRYRQFYAYLRTSIADGNSFKKSFLAYKDAKNLLPGPVQQLIIAGEKSGNLDEILKKINQNYEALIDTSSKNLTTMLEPVLLVIVWLGVVAVALAVILPIYNLVGQLST